MPNLYLGFRTILELVLVFCGLMLIFRIWPASIEVALAFSWALTIVGTFRIDELKENS